MINLLIQHYNDSSPERCQELRQCLYNNNNNVLIDNIYLFSDVEPYDYEWVGSNKIIEVKINKRLAFQDCIDFANKNLNGQICIISNADIYFDETLEKLYQKNLDNTMLAITRHELMLDNTQVLHSPASDCQDAWIFKSPFTINIDPDCVLGIPGCDNHFAYVCVDAKVRVINPAKDIRCIHVHTSHKRNYAADGFRWSPRLNVGLTNWDALGELDDG